MLQGEHFAYPNGSLSRFLCAASGGVLHGQEQNCGEIAAIARMAHAESSSIVMAEKQKAGYSYRAEVVFAVRSLELRPMDKSAAVRLLYLIPKDDAQQSIWVALGDALCDGESLDEMKSLGWLGGPYHKTWRRQFSSYRKSYRAMSPAHRSRYRIHIATKPCRWNQSAGPNIQLL